MANRFPWPVSAAIILMPLALTRCAPATFRIAHDASDPVLIPPGLRDASHARKGACSECAPVSFATLRKRTQPDIVRNGYEDLNPGDSLRVISPVFKPGASADTAIETTAVTGSGFKLDVTAKSSADLIGYELAWYSILRKPAGGCAIAPRSAELHIAGDTKPEAAPRDSLFHFAPDACAFRLFVLTRRSESDHDVFLVAAPDSAQMADETRRLQAAPESCNELGPARCVRIPRLVSVNAFVTVTVNGAQRDVEKGSTVESLIHGAPLAQLTVRRLYRGELRPVVAKDLRDIFALPLEGGDEISWAQ